MRGVGHPVDVLFLVLYCLESIRDWPSDTFGLLLTYTSYRFDRYTWLNHQLHVLEYLRPIPHDFLPNSRLFMFDSFFKMKHILVILRLYASKCR